MMSYQQEGAGWPGSQAHFSVSALVFVTEQGEFSNRTVRATEDIAAE